MSYQEALVLFALLLRFDKKLFYPLFYYCNFSTYNKNATTTAIDLQSALNTQQAVWLFGYDVITCKKKTNHQVHTFRRFCLKFTYFSMFLNSRINWIILKTDDKQFTLTTKKSLHIIFNVIYVITVTSFLYTAAAAAATTTTILRPLFRTTCLAGNPS